MSTNNILQQSSKQNYYLFFIAIAVSLGGFVFGFDAAVISGVVGSVSREFQLNVWQEGLVVSAPTLAAIIASLTVVPLSDIIGRKKMLLFVAVLYVVSAIFSAFANSFNTLVIARGLGFYQASYQIDVTKISHIDVNTLKKITPLIGKKYADDLSFKHAVTEEIGLTILKTMKAQSYNLLFNLILILC